MTVCNSVMNNNWDTNFRTAERDIIFRNVAFTPEHQVDSNLDQSEPLIGSIGNNIKQLYCYKLFWLCYLELQLFE